LLFNSPIFLIFAVVFFSVWTFVKRQKAMRFAWIVLASCIFYGWWDWRFLLLIFGSGFVDYFAALGIVRYQSSKQLILSVSLLANIGCLGLFKYFGFFMDSIRAIAASFDLTFSSPSIDFLLPVGISFYTFQSMSYTIDVYRGSLKPTRDLLHFFAYLMMFPQLVAGPIVRAADLLPQLKSMPRTTERDRAAGMRLIALGLLKKTVVADNLGPVVNAAYSNTLLGGPIMWWLIATMFAVQIYCDFSGYSDIARGLGRWMGVVFPVNFNHPYLACGFSEFWSRWHISLSSWFRDYVYIPLGGSRLSTARSIANVWITMLLSGLWHGASWTFVVWGGIHAALLSFERVLPWPTLMSRSKLLHVLAIAITALLAVASFVPFRADNMAQAIDVLGCMFGMIERDLLDGTSTVPKDAVLILGIFAIHEILIAVRKHRQRIDDDAVTFGWSSSVLYAAVLVIAVVFRGPGLQFVYFQF